MRLTEIKDISSDDILEEKKKKGKAFKKKVAKSKTKKKLKRKQKKKGKKPNKTGFKMKRQKALKALKDATIKTNKKYSDDDRQAVLSSFLDIDYDEVDQGYDDTIFDADGGEYFVLTDDEADDKVAEYIKESVWAFVPNFLEYHMDHAAIVEYEGGSLDIEGDPDDEDSEDYEISVDDWFSEFSEYGSVAGWIKEKQKGSEDANKIFTKVIPDMDSFVEDAVSTDGRGHFLSSYDGDESEEGDFYIYRLN